MMMEPAPSPLEMVEDLHRAVYGDMWARPESPERVWAMLLAKVRGLAAGWCGECERRARTGAAWRESRSVASSDDNTL